MIVLNNRASRVSVMCGGKTITFLPAESKKGRIIGPSRTEVSDEDLKKIGEHKLSQRLFTEGVLVVAAPVPGAEADKNPPAGDKNPPKK